MSEPLRDWLAAQGLAQLADLLVANEVDLEVLPELDDSHLRELGIALGPRLKLLKAIERLRSGSSPGEPARAAPAAPPPPPVAAPSAERRQLTVMFVDLVGSTALSARLDPEDMSAVIRAYQNAVAGEVGRVDGYVAKFMGDGVLAYFGWPRAHEDAAERAVRAALAIVAAVAGQTGGGEAMAGRIGIATGLVVVGERIGDGSAQEEAVVGDTPNLAARLQASAAPGEVVIADATRRLLGELFTLVPLEALSLKGLDEPVQAFAVRGEAASESRFAARSGAERAPLVGREGEMAMLQERWNAASAGQGQLVLLVGEAGLGKSRIVQAMVDALPAGHVRITWQCSPYHADSALYPAIQQIGRAAGFLNGDDTAARLDKLEELLRRTTGDIAAAGLLAPLFGLDGSDRYASFSGNPALQRSRTLEALLDQLTALARHGPVLWVIEDAHWIDPTTQELVELALDRVAHGRILVLLTARPTYSQGFGGHPIVTRLSLNRLGRESVTAIVGRITRGKPLPTTLMDEIAARTDGVPLFVEEMTKALLESGRLRETATDWQLDGPLNALAIPTSLHDSLMARLDRLQPVKEVAQTAAVIGRAFDHATLAALSPLPAGELAQALDRLVAAELVFRRGVGSEATYLFKHALVRDAAYESLLKSRRLVLHLRLLEILEVASAPPELLAQHAQTGGDAGRAIGWWRAAAEAAVAQAAFEEAEAHLDAAQALLPALAEEAQRRRVEAGIAVTRAQASLVSHGYARDLTGERYARADVLATAADDPLLVLTARYGVWAFHHVREDVGRALTVGEQMCDEASRRQDRDLATVAYRLLGTSQTMAGRFDEAQAAFARSRACYDPSRQSVLARGTGTDPLVALNCYQALAELAAGFPDHALALAKEAWAVSQDVEQLNGRAYAAYHVAMVAALARQPAWAEELAMGVLAMANARGLAFWNSVGGAVMAWCRLESRDPVAAIDWATRALRAAQVAGNGIMGAVDRSVLAEALAATGDASALDRADEAVALARRTGALYAMAEIQRRRGIVLRWLRPDDGAAAEAAFRRALVTSREQNACLWELRAARDLARLMADQGRRREARDLLAPILSAFTEGFGTADLIESRALLDSLA